MGRQPTGPLVAAFDELPGGGADPLHLRVYRRLRAAILDGSLAPGSRLPSSRTFARDLGVSRNTVEAAFSQLDVEGFLERRVGSGTFVARLAPQRPAGGQTAAPDRVAGDGPALSARGRRLAGEGRGTRRCSGGGFAPCTPDVAVFPIRAWQKLLARRARRLDRELLGQPDPMGYRPLREAVAAYLGISRGVACDWRRVLILGSTQEALDLSARLLTDPGDAVWLEEPGYLGARAAFRGAGARVVPVPVDGDGVDVAEGIRRAPDARMAYVTPSHQYPLGYTLGLVRRLALLEWAAEVGAWVFEDDYDSEFRYVGRPLAAVQGLDRAGRVLYAGTFSKPLFPSLRMAYLVLPEALVEPFVAARASVAGPLGTLMQGVLADFIGDGHFGAHVRTVRGVYQERRMALLDALGAELPGRVQVLSSDTGLHVVLALPPGTDDDAVSARAAARGLELPSLSHYYLGPESRPGLVVHYSSVGAAEIRSGVATLRQVLDEMAARTRSAVA